MNINVCAIVVTYNPAIEIFFELITSLVNQCNIVVVDNCSTGECVNDIYELSSRFDFTLLSQPENTGIAKAQNIGIDYINTHMPDTEYLVFFDQDSIPDNNLINILHHEYLKLESSNIAMIGPTLYDPRSNTYSGFHILKNFKYSHVHPDVMPHDTIECLSVNSSGSFCSLNIFKIVGKYNEGLFIDHVETEWCFRARNLGYKFFGTKLTKITHYMGDDIIEFPVLFKKITLPYRSNLRHYYLFRNSFFLLKKNYVPMIWKIYCVFKLLFTFVLFGFFSKESSRQRRSMILGIKDGFKGISGKFF